MKHNVERSRYIEKWESNDTESIGMQLIFQWTERRHHQ